MIYYENLTFDPGAGVKNGVITFPSVLTPGQKVLFTNISGTRIILNFDNGNVDILQAGQANYWILSNLCPEIYWRQAIDQLALATVPMSKCTVTVFEENEEVQGHYPVSLIYFQTVANQGGVPTSVSGSTTDIINDGVIAGHTYIESTPLGQTNSTFTLGNTGLMMLSTIIGGTYHQQFLTRTTGNSPVIGQSGDTTEIFSNLQIDGTTSVKSTETFDNNVNLAWLNASGTLRNILKVDTSNNVVAVMADANVMQFKTQAGVEVFRVNTSGIDMTVGTATSLTALNVTSTNNIVSNNNAIVTNRTNSGSIQANTGAFYGTDGSNSIISASGTSGTGRTRLQSTDEVDIQAPGGSNQVHINSSGTFFDNDVDFQTHNAFNLNTISGSGDGVSWLAHTPSGTTRVQSPTNVTIQVPGGSSRLTVNTTSVVASVQVQTPSINVSTTKTVNGLDWGSFTLTTSPQTISHGLGVTPGIVVIIEDQAGGTATVSTGSYTSTTFVAKGAVTGQTYRYFAIG